MATAPKAAIAPQIRGFYLPELDTLRFCAFAGVFIFHASAEVGVVSTITVAGSYGVDLFFCLSAFLISTLLLREKESTGTLNVSAFWIRRGLRIWPLYFGMLAVATALGQFNWKTLLACMFFTGNFGFIFWGMPAFIGPLWSVSVEEQFYLVWPLVVRYLNRERIALVAVLLCAVSIAARCVMTTFAIAHPEWPASCTIMNTFCRLDPIAVGLLLASVGSTWRAVDLKARLGFGAAGVLIFFETAHLVNEVPEAWLLSHVLANSAVAIGCLFLVIATIGAKGIARNSTLVYLGRISYGLYVFHEPALLIAHRLTSAMTIPLGAAMTIAIAAASYRWFESPFLRLKSRFEFIASRPI